VKRELAITGLEDGPLALDLFNDRKAERVSLESRQPAHVLNIENDSRETERHGLDSDLVSLWRSAAQGAPSNGVTPNTSAPLP
jgi:hypothetical protein